jgi:outer membrane protein assembly factor BamD (BamD/ComL family)
MSLMSTRFRLSIFTLLLLWVAGGCAMWGTKKKQAALPPPTDEQLAFWEVNRDRAHYVPGKGYAIDGAPGYYDDQGRRVPDEQIADVARTDANFDVEAESFSERSKRVTNNWKKLWGKGPNEKIAKAAFADGDSLFRQAKYEEAAKKFKIAYDRGPDLPQEEEALFKAGEAYFFCDRYSKSNDYYGILVKKYSSTAYLDQIVARRFAIARYWEQCDHNHHHWALTPNLADKTRPLFDTRGHALKCYDRVRLDDPTGPLADDSIMAAANAYFSWGAYEDADYYYTLLTKEYPRSEHQFMAHLLGFKTKLLRYQGPDYDPKPLEEADEVAKQLLTQFPTELGDERQKIMDEQSRIVAERAKRVFVFAEYYYKNKYYAASRLYYQDVIEKWPDTQLAQTSRTRIGDTKGKPDAPTPPFQWIVDLLPQEKTGALGNGVATSGLVPGMGQSAPGIGTLGGMGSGNAAGVPSGTTTR